MRPEDKLLFACTRQNFLYAHQKIVLDLCSKEKILWDVVYLTARQHGVAALVYTNLLKCIPVNLGIPHDVIEKLKLCVATNIVRKDRRAEKIVEILSFFKKKSIDVMLIKGAALDILVYDQPWYMISDDIDLIVKLKREDLTAEDREALSALQRHFTIECGYFEHHDVDMSGVLPINFQRIWANANKIEYRGYDVFVMSPEDMLMSVCINSCRKRFFRLKALCDIAEIVNKYHDLKWDELVRNSREYHCNSIVYTALLVAKMALGCEVPEGVLDKLTDSTTRVIIIRYLARHLSRKASLSSFPYCKRDEKDRMVTIINLALILPYATYRWYQLWRKMKHTWKTKRFKAFEFV